MKKNTMLGWLKRAISCMMMLIMFSTEMLPVMHAEAANVTPKKSELVTYYSVTQAEVEARLNELLAMFPDGSKWKDTFNNKKTCYGFAWMVIYYIFGRSTTPGKTFRGWDYAGDSQSGMNLLGQINNYTANDVKNLLSRGKPGDVIQYQAYRSNGHQHTMLIWSVCSDGVIVYHSNGDGNKTTRREFKSWSTLANMQYYNNGSRKRTYMSLLRSANYVDTPSNPNSSTYTVYFDANGGSCDRSYTYVTKNSAYGSLPNASRTNYTFDGWYTAASGGSRVTSSTIYRSSSNSTLYAHWTAVPSTLSISGFVGPTGVVKGSFGLRGVITSNYPIVKISAYLVKNGQVYNDSRFIYNASPNRTTYNIRYDGINDKFAFRKLASGSYSYVVVATDQSGQVITRSTSFTKK